VSETSRRGLFKSLVGQAAKAAADEVERRLPTYRRPPGALPSEAGFLAACEKCWKCVEACPENAIFTVADGANVAARTPVMQPDQRACHMCDGFPCAAACPTEALTVPTTSAVTLGKVRISEDRCFVFKGPECGACAGLCPDGVDALRLVIGRPTIDDEACVGCGICIHACPVRPSAVELLPLAQ
jgi:ferredoxin-type protein NapG